MSRLETRALSDVPEEGASTPVRADSPGPRSPRPMHGVPGAGVPGIPAAAAAALSPVGPPPRSPLGPRKPLGATRTASERSLRMGTSSAEASPTRASTTTPAPRRQPSTSGASVKDGKGAKKVSGDGTMRLRTTPRLPHDKDARPAPATLMYWSMAPVFGQLPTRGMRAHTATLVDNVAWIFGGCDEKGCWQDVWCFDTETMQWVHPQMLGEIPPPCRAHTATLVDRKLIVFGGGQGPQYYNDVYVLDTVTRRWVKPVVPRPIPAPRRAHTAVLFRGKLWVFGGGNGMEALNDVWTLDVSAPVDRMRWELIETHGKKPTPRGYHTANLVGSVIVVVGGSDGRECFSDVWCLNLDSLVWSHVKLDVAHRRLSHSSTQVGSYLFITGGHDGSNYTSELLLFNLVSLQYEPRQTVGKRPSPRGYHVSLLADSRLFLFGGFNGHEVYDDVFVLDLAAAAYLPQVTSFKIDVE